MTERILLIGSGGREHALAWKLSQSVNVNKIFVAPGNAGTSCSKVVSNIALNVKDFESVSKWCKENDITFIMVGPEDPLAAGIVDFLSKAGFLVFGPTASAARIEADKSFSKQFMVRHGIPTAKFQTFTNSEEACEFITKADFEPLVVKASGLAAGKGVVVSSTRQEARKAAKEMLTGKAFGSAGDVIVVEELLEGPEVSVLAFSDGQNVCLMPPAQDNKRLLDNDEGPNTGGMGAICPYPGLSQTEINRIQKNVIEKTIHGLAKEGIKYVGVLYAGLMLTKNGPRVLEFNCRFGDPETQPILSLMTSDLLMTLKACVNGTLPLATPTFDTSMTAVGVVVVSGGYPGPYQKGLEIIGIQAVETSGLKVFHAGTVANSEGKAVTNGGRVLAVVARDSSLSSAITKATEGAAFIQFDGAYFRKDIGVKILKSLGGKVPHHMRDVHEHRGHLSYKDAGVDIAAGDYLVQAIKPLAKMTKRSGCDADLGGFGGVFDLMASGLSNSVLACRTCGVGRKIKFAENRGHHYNIGFDLVAQCVNDLITRGAEPVYFLDYFATGKLNVRVAEEVVRGMADGCLQAGCALIGGETAEMPGMYRGGDFDVAGLAVGAIPQSRLLLQCGISLGDAVVAVTCSGLQHKDFTVLEEILRANSMNLHTMKGVNGGVTLAEEILVPTSVYVKSVLPLMYSGKVKSFVYMTAGLTPCLTRVLPPDVGVKLNAEKWQIGPVFGWMANMADLSPADLAFTCSCGVAALLVVPAMDVPVVVESLSQNLVDPVKVIGQVVPRAGDTDQVIIDNLVSAVEASRALAFQHAPENFESSASETGVPHIPSLFIKPNLSSIFDLAPRPGAIASRDGLPATFDLSDLKLDNPVLVSGTDGVGTKLKVAQALHKHSTIGIDLVAMCVNDVLASGADPLFFTCYLATGRQNPDWLEEVLKGVATGCKMAGCALVEQEVSAIPSIYSGSVYDLGGFCTAAVERSSVLPNLADITSGDVLIGLPSSGIHSNGFSLVRRIVEVHKLRFDMPSPFDKSVSLGHELLRPTEIYVKPVLPAMQAGKVKAFAHITGGGLVENIPRVLPPEFGAQLDANRWNIPAVFGWLQHMGKISDHEMSRTFNLGLGGVLVVAPQQVSEVLAILSSSAVSPYVVGSVVQNKGDTERFSIQNLHTSLAASWTRPRNPSKRKKVAVLISGSGTNLQALIDHTQTKSSRSAAEITLVISNVPKVYGLIRAEKAGIKSLVINHKQYKTREAFDGAVHECLEQHGIELVCLAGFMRILTGEFVNKWTGRMLNIHPSLLPSFKGAHAQQMAIDAGVRISGCTVHFVAEEVDAGAIVAQESVPVYPGDTKDTLAERIKSVEHIAYPAALEIVANERVVLAADGKLVWNW